jgi:hypothetical protein
MSDELAAPAAVCANCGAALHGRFCAACGQEAKPLDPPVSHVVTDFAQEFFDVDGRQLRSLRRLVFSPGFLTREYVEGRRVGWLSPLKLYLLCSVAAFAMLAVAGNDGGLRISMTGGQRFGFENDAQLAAAIAAAREVSISRVAFALVPFFAWLVALARRSSGRRYPSHLVFALHVHAAGFAVRAVMSALGLVLPATVALTVNGLVPIYLLVYLPVAFHRAYGGTWPKALGDTVVVGAVYWLVGLLVAGAVVLGIVLLPRLIGG